MVVEAGVVSVGPADEPQLCLVGGVQELADALSGVVAHQVGPPFAVAADGVHELAQLRLSEHDRANSTNLVGYTVFALLRFTLRRVRGRARPRPRGPREPRRGAPARRRR